MLGSNSDTYLFGWEILQICVSDGLTIIIDHCFIAGSMSLVHADQNVGQMYYSNSNGAIAKQIVPCLIFC